MRGILIQFLFRTCGKKRRKLWQIKAKVVAKKGEYKNLYLENDFTSK